MELKRLATTYKDCLAVLWAILPLRPYLEQSRYTVRTDHQALKQLLTMTEAYDKLDRW